MKKDFYDKLFFFLLGILVGVGSIILFSFVWVNLFQEKISEEGNIKIVESEQEIIENCSNLDLINTSNCLVNNIKTFYIYNVTDDDLELSFEEIKKYGGDCRNYAFLYERLGNELGFNVTTVRNGGVKGLYNAHRYAVLWDEENYCKIDLIKDVRCYKILK